jgi:hypothetical protein
MAFAPLSRIQKQYKDCNEGFKCFTKFIIVFSFSLLPPPHHNEFFHFIFPAGLTGYVAALFLGWL